MTSADLPPFVKFVTFVEKTRRAHPDARGVAVERPLSVMRCSSAYLPPFA
jgi:hypothetical protein